MITLHTAAHTAARTASALCCLAVLAVASGCAMRSAAPISGPGAGVDDSSRRGGRSRVASTGHETAQAIDAARVTTREGLPGAAAAPLEDLNIRRAEIPQILTAIEYVYNAAPAPDCVDITREVARLDVALGRDYDVEADERGAGRRGGEAAGDLVVDTIRGVTTDFIPFRSIVREASGAAAFERRRSRAFAAGYARRAYLKGLALGQGCPPPAAPLIIVTPVDEPRVELRQTRDAPADNNWGAPGTRREQ